MQVDRQPSPWPCVAMLAGLLLLCLMVPRYWRSKISAEAAKAPDENQQTLPQATTHLPFGWTAQQAISVPRRRSVPDIDPLQLWRQPTIEELIAARAGVRDVEEPLFGWPVIVPAATRPEHQHHERSETPAEAPAVPGPRMTAMFQRIGRLLAEYSPMEALPPLSAKIAEVHRQWLSQQVVINEPQPPAPADIAREQIAPAPTPPPSTLRLVVPEHGMAIVAPQVDSSAPVTEPFPADTVPIAADTEPIAASPQAAPATRNAPDPWCVPETLLEQLERLARHPASADWAERTIAQLHALTRRDRFDGDDVQTLLRALSDSAEEAAQMADHTGEDRLRVGLLRAHWALARRLDCWAAVHDIRVAERSSDRLALHGPLQSFFHSKPGIQAQAAHSATLPLNLEAYERSRNPQLGRTVVHQQRALESSSEALDRSLADAVEQHYRNANVRVALTAELLNRLVARERSEVQALRDRIAGTPVRGRSQTQSESRVRLEPVSGYWQMTLEAEGQVDSNTVADGGSAQVRSHSTTEFAARKSVLVDSAGVRLDRTVVDASNHNRLVGVTTDFDWVPVLGSFARDRAISQYRARRERAKAEVEYRVSSQAVDRVDLETLEAVQRIERQVRERLTDRLADAGVDLTPIEMATTPKRLVGRFRVAGDHQLGSHTPRPRALSDSLASVQVHETALTNAAVTLSLDGGSYTAPELQQLLREKFPRMATNGAAVREDVVFHFAQEDAVRFHIQGGRLELALSLAKVEQDRRTMRDFIVHAYYVPVVNGLEAELVRDGSLGIEGRLSSADRARLHNVFDSVLPPERRLPILRLDNPDDPRLEGLMITQLVLEDGWLGLAIGPAYRERVAERCRSLR